MRVAAVAAGAGGAAGEGTGGTGGLGGGGIGGAGGSGTGGSVGSGRGGSPPGRRSSRGSMSLMLSPPPGITGACAHAFVRKSTARRVPVGHRRRRSPPKRLRQCQAMLIGGHVSTRGGIDKAIDNAVAIGAEVIQTHPSPPQTWRRLTVDDAKIGRAHV